MPDNFPSILPLPPEVAAQIKSSTAIPSLRSIVLGLIANSLDAKAHKIDVNVDFRRGAASVEDDGHGIPPNEFAEAGGLGKPHREQFGDVVKNEADGSQTHLRTKARTLRMGGMGPS